MTSTIATPVGNRPANHEPFLLDVALTDLGNVTILCDALTAASLAGRTDFRDANVRELLADRIAEAWYGNDCPPLHPTVVERIAEYTT